MAEKYPEEIDLESREHSGRREVNQSWKVKSSCFVFYGETEAWKFLLTLALCPYYIRY